jgi:hypothetical protein
MSGYRGTLSFSHKIFFSNIRSRNGRQIVLWIWPDLLSPYGCFLLAIVPSRGSPFNNLATWGHLRKAFFSNSGKSPTQNPEFWHLYPCSMWVIFRLPKNVFNRKWPIDIIQKIFMNIEIYFYENIAGTLPHGMWVRFNPAYTCTDSSPSCS